MKREKKIQETAFLLFNKAQVRMSSPHYSDAETIVDRIIERAMWAGCPIAERIDLTRCDNNRVCTISWEDALVVSEYYENYVEQLFTVEFYMKDGTVKVSAHRDFQEVERLRKKGVLINAISE